MADDTTYTVLGEGRYLRLVCDENGWEHVQRTNATAIVAIIPVTADGKAVFVEQYRPPVRNSVIEFPAGLVGDTAHTSAEDLLSAARRELLEETGFEAGEMRRLTEGPPSAGMSTEVVTFFLATGLVRRGAGGGDDSESITVHEVPLDEADAWLEERARAGRLLDPKVYTGLYFARGARAGS